MIKYPHISERYCKYLINKKSYLILKIFYFFEIYPTVYEYLSQCTKSFAS